MLGASEMSNETRIALVGAGLVGQQHARAIGQIARLDAVIDPAPQASSVAKEHGATCWKDLETYLTNTRPDGIIVASPTQMHLEHGLAALARDIPVLIEKPLTESARSGQRLVEAASTSRAPVLVGHHRRHSPITQAVKSCLDEGRLGRLVAVNAMFWLNKPADYFDIEWRTRAGGGPTYINLIHDIDLLQYFCGPIVSVQAREGHKVRRSAGALHGRLS